MTAMRMGKTARDIFVATDVLPVADAAPRTPGRPKEHEEPYTKATVVLRNSQIVQLDRLSTEIRSKTGGVVQRAQLIRAVVDAVLGSGLDLTDAYDEEGIRVTVARRLRAAQP